MLFQLECAEERVAKPLLLTSRPTHHPVVPSHGLPAISAPDAEQGPSLPPGMRGETFLPHPPEPRHLCFARQDMAAASA